MGPSIRVERPISAKRGGERRGADWPVGAKEAPDCSWYYEQPETWDQLKGEVTVTPDGGEGGAVRLTAGDRGMFSAGLRCTGTIQTAVRKHETVEALLEG
jgi:uncharacterized cupin superfamily protein